MNYQKVLYWSLQIVGWFGLSALLYVVNRANNIDLDVKRVLVLVAFALNGIFLSHLLREVLLKLDFLKTKPLQIFTTALVGCSLTALVFQIVYEFVQSALTEHELFGSLTQFLAQMLVMLLVFASWSLVYFVNHYFRAMRKNELNNIKLEAQKQQIELALMRSQLNPHFLFNSLNSIRALISDQPADAKMGITKLSNLLRNILIYSRREWVTVEEELAFVKDYLDLEKIRFEERLQYHQYLEGEPEKLQIPPMTIQILVENAVKHGINNLKNGGTVDIHVKKTATDLIIHVINDGNLQQKTDTGVGIANIKKRLRQSFLADVELHLEERDAKVSAQIIIPL